MNRLSTQQRARIVACLVEGNSIRGTCRLTGAAKNTVAKLLVDLGVACSDYQDRVLVDLPCERIQCDEIWSFCHARAKNLPADKQGKFGYGSIWTWVALDPDSKLVPTWRVGEHDAMEGVLLLQDLRRRIPRRIQLTTDGWGSYAESVEEEYGADVDYAQVVKHYVSPQREGRRGALKDIEIKVLQGAPDPDKIGTSYVERQNLTMRMSMRRFQRFTNGFSKKVENLVAAVSLHFMHYNFARPHQSLRKANGYPTTPAMAAGVTDHVWTIRELVALLDEREAAQRKLASK